MFIDYRVLFNTIQGSFFDLVFDIVIIHIIMLHLIEQFCLAPEYGIWKIANHLIFWSMKRVYDLGIHPILCQSDHRIRSSSAALFFNLRNQMQRN